MTIETHNNAKTNILGKISKESVKSTRSYSTKFKHWPIIDIAKSTGDLYTKIIKN